MSEKAFVYKDINMLLSKLHFTFFLKNMRERKEIFVKAVKRGVRTVSVGGTGRHRHKQ
jgi:hypothetical protein